MPSAGRKSKIDEFEEKHGREYTTIYNDAGHARMEVARAQVKAGDIAAAKQTAGLVQGEPSWKYDAWRAIAEGQIKAGDMPGAQDSLRIALKTVATYGLGIVCGTMVEAQSGVDGLLKMQFRL